jgi:hypothetical protein
MAFVVKENKSANPEDVRFLCLGAVVLLAAGDSDLVKQAWLVRGTP